MQTIDFSYAGEVPWETDHGPDGLNGELIELRKAIQALRVTITRNGIGMILGLICLIAAILAKGV
jgi:hypothetical protein